MFVARHAFASALVAVSLAVVAALFVFARPQYAPEHPSTNLDMAHRAHYTVQQVRAAFAHHGIRLDHGGPMMGANGAWLVMLSAVPAPVDTNHLQVSVFGPKAKVGWSETGSGYETLFGNVAVSYDGPSDDVLRRAKAAVAELRS